MSYAPFSNATTPLSQSNITEESITSSESPTRRISSLNNQKPTTGSQRRASPMPRMQSLPAKVLSESIYGKEFRSHQTRANIRGVQSREVMCEANNNDFSALKQISKDEDIFERTCNQERRASTGTLNRLILVAQALESEVDSRRQTDVNGGRVVFSIRMANLILLFLLNALILTGVGQYNSPHVGKHQLMLTADKWFYRPDAHLPITFSEMQLSGQYLASGLSILMLLITIALQLWHICHTNNSRLIVSV
ncbi:unnamed protein product [Toxocara canis]|uniref:Transmembrane protein n=1 Tax=Toxocara canis TaxID=6265 RepID=A0A183URG2_TOXCA|nr:unnamed protein product [Toxocara canis]